MAQAFEIVSRKRPFPLDVARIADFTLGEGEAVDPQSILENDNITLYTLDFDGEQAVFVETPPELNLSNAPFYYVAQFEQAIRVLTLPFAKMIQLAESIVVDGKRLVLIHSVGRAGSTLASQLFAHVDGVINLSEPDALSILVRARHEWPDQDPLLRKLFDATVRLLCKVSAERAWVIKGRSYGIELGEWFFHQYPQAKTLFLDREIESWLVSCLRAYDDGVERSEKELLAYQSFIREFVKPVTPLIAEYDPNQHLSFVGILSLVWLSVMRKVNQLQALGADMMIIPYENWRDEGRETAVAMLKFCHCLPKNFEMVDEVLAQDSQAGTFLAQDALQGNSFLLETVDISEYKMYLQKYQDLIETERRSNQ